MHIHWLRPDWEPGVTIAHLPLEHLLDYGVRALVIDVDRTLLPGRDIHLPNSVQDWIAKAKVGTGLKLHLLSNNPSQRRIGAVAEQLKLSFTCAAAKPRSGALKKVLGELKFQPQQIGMVGDRLFTDVLAGNRLGLYTILVCPLRDDGRVCTHDRVQRIERYLSHLVGVKR